MKTVIPNTNNKSVKVLKYFLRFPSTMYSLSTVDGLTTKSLNKINAPLSVWVKACKTHVPDV